MDSLWVQPTTVTYRTIPSFGPVRTVGPGFSLVGRRLSLARVTAWGFPGELLGSLRIPRTIFLLLVAAGKRSGEKAALISITGIVVPATALQNGPRPWSLWTTRRVESTVLTPKRRITRFARHWPSSCFQINR